MTKRDFSLIGITALVMCIPIGILASKNSVQQTLPSSAYDWNDLKASKVPNGWHRDVFNSATQTLDNMELHITTLGVGDSSHAPHRHPNEELLIIKEGTASALVSGQWKTLGPGSVVYEASNQWHAIRNAGTTTTTYYVLQWHTPKTTQMAAVKPTN